MNNTTQNQETEEEAKRFGGKAILLRGEPRPTPKYFGEMKPLIYHDRKV